MGTCISKITDGSRRVWSYRERVGAFSEGISRAGVAWNCA